jgi:hypothetical protein
MGEVNKQSEGAVGGGSPVKGPNTPFATKKGNEVVIPETHEVTVKARIAKAPNLSVDGLTEFPCAAILVYANGTRVVLPIRQPKPSSASGKINAWGGGKMALEDNTQVQVGINLTVME